MVGLEGLVGMVGINGKVAMVIMVEIGLLWPPIFHVGPYGPCMASYGMQPLWPPYGPLVPYMASQPQSLSIEYRGISGDPYFFLHILSSWAKISLQTGNELPELPRSADGWVGIVPTNYFVTSNLS